MPAFNVLLLLLFSQFVFSAETHHYGQFHYTIDPQLPAWVKATKVKTAKGKTQGQSTEYVLLDTQVHAIADDFQKYRAFSMKLHTSQAVSENSELEIYFNPQYQQLVLHKISIVRGKQTIDVLKPEILRLLQQEDDLRNGIYTGAVTAIAIVPDTRPGDRLDYSYTLMGRNPVYGKKIFGAHRFGWGVDVGFSQLRVLVDAETKLQTRVHKLAPKYKQKTRQGYTEHLWQAKSVDGREDEGDYPAWYVRYPFIEYSEYQSWQQVVAWAEGLYNSLDQNAELLDELVKSLKQQYTSAEDYALAALDYTQEQIRYLGLEFGENSHLPHPPAEVLAKRYGDCKDKSNLLVQLLNKNGIEAHPALVSYDFEQGFRDFLPSPMAFDHAIVVAEIDGKQVWLDPTRTWQTGRLQDLAYLDFGAALVINKNRSNPIAEINRLPGQMDRVRVVENFKVDSVKKAVKLRIESRYYGDKAEYQRYYFNSNTVQEIRNNYLNYYAKIYSGITSDGELQFVDKPESNEFIIYEFYKIPDFFEENEGLYKSSYFAATINQYLSEPDTIRRESPTDIGPLREISHKIVIDFMGDVGMYIDSTPLIKKSPSMDYVSRSVLLPRRFEHSAQLTVKQRHVDSEKIAEFLTLSEKIEQDIDFSLSFVYPYKNSTSPSLKRLLNALEK